MFFALDSIPAVLSITKDPFIAYTSNIFAILGLRALYFCLASAMSMFLYLPNALSFVLVFIGVKMELSLLGFQIGIFPAMLIIFSALSISIILSILSGKK
eukprot:Sdes_comp20879_c0_seq1m17877